MRRGVERISLGGTWNQRTRYDIMASKRTSYRAGSSEHARPSDEVLELYLRAFPRDAERVQKMHALMLLLAGRLGREELLGAAKAVSDKIW